MDGQSAELGTNPSPTLRFLSGSHQASFAMMDNSPSRGIVHIEEQSCRAAFE